MRAAPRRPPPSGSRWEGWSPCELQAGRRRGRKGAKGQLPQRMCTECLRDAPTCLGQRGNKQGCLRAQPDCLGCRLWCCGASPAIQLKEKTSRTDCFQGNVAFRFCVPHLGTLEPWRRQGLEACLCAVSGRFLRNGSPSSARPPERGSGPFLSSFSQKVFPPHPLLFVFGYGDRRSMHYSCGLLWKLHSKE
jgi:hypothetical protein